VIGETMAFLQAHPVAASPKAAVVLPFRSRRWVIGVSAGLAAAAAVVLAVRIARPPWVDGLFGPRGDRPELQELIAALANEPTRPVEGRLTGGFKYAPPPSPTRGPGDRQVSPDVRIAAAKIERSFGSDRSARGETAVGLAYLAIGQMDKGVASLERAAAAASSSAAIWSDLSAAYLARRNAGDVERALDAARRARQLESALPEAAFNEALAQRAAGNSMAERAAWAAYGRLDRSSQWAMEIPPEDRR
jgi:tetratricopeptide (TPR) repeat protein